MRDAGQDIIFDPVPVPACEAPPVFREPAAIVEVPGDRPIRRKPCQDHGDLIVMIDRRNAFQ
jgi:hypothetical protein